MAIVYPKLWPVAALASLFAIPFVVTANKERQAKRVPFSHVGSNQACCISPDGTKIAVLGWTGLADGHWVVWDVATGRQMPIRGVSLYCLSFSSDSRLLASDIDRFFEVTDLATGGSKQLKPENSHWTGIHQIEFTPDGKRLITLSADHTVRVWNAANYELETMLCFETRNQMIPPDWRLKYTLLKTGDPPPEKAKQFTIIDKASFGVYSFAVAPDSRSIAIAAGTSEISFVDLLSGKLTKTLQTGLKNVARLHRSKDGRLLVVAGGFKESTIEVWDLSLNKKVRIFQGQSGIKGLAISSDKSTVVSGGEGARAWDMKTGLEKCAPYKGRDQNILGVGFLPDGRTFYALPEGERPLEFWDTTTGRAVSPITR
jgi:WD40 repeat protein